ncbi:EAL domain-containing protein [Thioalkalivibrio sp. ALJ16]|uniref:EAL domain-containing protein n=1 Tax=Thioalkalivibrio sp. ALJ16 TaxID=1158762 RepID=UPI0003724E44|nr:EAL domain-containing protein [Thioalkalivibrio sp. ALJ16]
MARRGPEQSAGSDAPSQPRDYRSAVAIAAGFTVVLLLMAVMVMIGLDRISIVNERLEVIVHEHNVKTEKLNNMRAAARERSVTLLRLSISDDPFDIDEGIMEFRGHASDFMINRNAFEAMQLNEREQALLTESRELTLHAVEVQERVLEKLLNGEMEAATAWLLDQAIPRQNEVLANLGALLDLQKEASEQAAHDTAEHYHQAIQFMSLLGGAALLIGIVVAISVLRRSRDIETDLFLEKERAQVTLHAIGDAVITIDTRGRIDYLNPVAEHLTGWTHAEAHDQQLAKVFRTMREDDGQPLPHPLLERVPDGTACSLNQAAILSSRDGHEYAIEEVSAPIRDRSGAIIGAALVFRDVSQAREMARDLSWAATHDCLTSLANRMEFERRLRQLVTSAHQDGHEHALLYMDLDQFKLVNDTCGHGAGDELLCQLTSLMQAHLRESDTLARLGGDEFGVLLESCPLERAEKIAEKLRRAIEQFRFDWEGRLFRIGISIGVVPVCGAHRDAVQFMSEADAACYLAKEGGRNRIHVSRPDDAALCRHQGEMNCLQRINFALQKDHFWLYGQHIEPIAGGPRHTEVLLRMLDEEGTLTSPNTFIPAAERYGLMPSVDRWVVDRVLQIAREHPGADGSYFAINLSGQSLCERGMLEYIVERIDASGVHPNRLCFEITETAAIANLSQASRFVNTLRAKGCCFSLDDFGTGMSSFGYLKTLRVDYIKIDGSFVRDMHDDAISRAMVESIHHIGSVMNIKTVAECVSHEGLLPTLKEIGIHYAQGFGVHCPEPLEPRPVIEAAAAKPEPRGTTA